MSVWHATYVIRCNVNYRVLMSRGWARFGKMLIYKHCKWCCHSSRSTTYHLGSITTEYQGQVSICYRWREFDSISDYFTSSSSLQNNWRYDKWPRMALFLTHVTLWVTIGLTKHINANDETNYISRFKGLSWIFMTDIRHRTLKFDICWLHTWSYVNHENRSLYFYKYIIGTILVT